MPTAITFNDSYNTLTTSVTNTRRITCGCGKQLEPGEAVGLTEMIAYQNRPPPACVSPAPPGLSPGTISIFAA